MFKKKKKSILISKKGMKYAKIAMRKTRCSKPFLCYFFSRMTQMSLKEVLVK